MKLKIENNEWTVGNDLWSVAIGRATGGCINSMVCFNGSNKNILAAPVSSRFSEYSDLHESAPEIRVLEKRKDRIAIKVRGVLRDRNGRSGGIGYDYIYEIRGDGCLKITRKFIPSKTSAKFSNMVVGRMEMNDSLGEYAASVISRKYRVNGNACVMESLRGSGFKIYGKTASSDGNVFSCDGMAVKLSFFSRGREGVEWLPASDLGEWEKFAGDNGKSRCSISYDPGKKRVVMAVEPFCSARPAALSGPCVFTSYLTLPAVREKQERRFRSIRFSPHPWPTEKQIENWARNGVNTIVFQDDNCLRARANWRDGSYPPYDGQGMRNLERMIASVHKHGMRIVPYFSNAHIHPAAGPSGKKIAQWTRAWPAADEARAYGKEVCYEAPGWRRFFKDSVKRVLTRHPFDGIYYDENILVPCDNRLHFRGRHTGADGLIDLMRWTRKFLGKDRIMIVHEWHDPLVLADNLADVVLTGEDIFHCRKQYGRLLELDEFTPHAGFMNIAPRLILSFPLRKEKARAVERFLAKCAVCGYFPEIRVNGPPGETYKVIDGREKERKILKFDKAFSGLDLGQYHFQNYLNRVVLTDCPNVKTAIYWKQDELLIVLSNLGEKQERFKWRVNLSGIAGKCEMGPAMTGLLRKKGLIGGVKGVLAGYEFRILRFPLPCLFSRHPSSHSRESA
ncbi:MAG: hypothetical protein PHV34_18940 [Verrucomicrobiae bacterium]|nr:hypothetical protein [Verrucomicrobiae bacterium]